MKHVAVVLSCALGVGLGGSLPAQEKKRVPVYTNEDLARVAPFRDQTGVGSQPAFSPSSETSREPRSSRGQRSSGEARSATRGEAYWRREAERLRERLRGPRETVAQLRSRIEQRRRKPGVFPSSDPQIQSWQERINVLEQRMREWESALEDRARREGAMPGWLR